jgi:hypothetical protein
MIRDVASLGPDPDLVKMDRIRIWSKWTGSGSGLNGPDPDLVKMDRIRIWSKWTGSGSGQNGPDPYLVQNGPDKPSVTSQLVIQLVAVR